MLTEKEREQHCKPQNAIESEVKLCATRYMYPIKKGYDIKDKTIVDLGCGYGWGAKLLFREKPKVIIGVELNDDTYKIATEHVGKDALDYRHGPCWDTKVDDKSVDFVWMVEIIEHMDDEEVDMTLAEVHRILKPDGILYISTPERGVAKELYPQGSHWTEYSLEELKERVTPGGFVFKSVDVHVGDRSNAFIFTKEDKNE